MLTIMIGHTKDQGARHFSCCCAHKSLQAVLVGLGANELTVVVLILSWLICLMFNLVNYRCRINLSNGNGSSESYMYYL